jgi:glycine C-acetyltransferase
MIMVDDSHAVGFVGARGRGTPELHGVSDRVDIVTGTLARRWAGPVAATPVGAARSLISFASVQGHTCFLTPWRLRWWVLR